MAATSVGRAILLLYWKTKLLRDMPRAGFMGGPGGPGPRPPTNRGPPTKPVIFYLSFSYTSPICSYWLKIVVCIRI